MADDERRAEQSKRMKCTRGLCDQRIPCAFYCWWNASPKALNYEANQHGRPAVDAGKKRNRDG